MPYCVNCGVELSPGAVVCPLCQTPAWHPDPTAVPYFPTRPAKVPPASKRALSALLSAMLASVSLCCGLLNLMLKPHFPWSLYVVGAAALMWVWFVLPLLVRHLPGFVRLLIDIAAVGGYILLIAAETGGWHWFFYLALPILGATGFYTALLSFLLRGRRHSALTSMAFTIAAAGLLVLTLELCIDCYLTGAYQPTWSLVVAAACGGLMIPLCIVRRIPSLREEARRRFHL